MSRPNSCIAEVNAIDAQLIRQWREETPGIRHRIHLNNAGASLMPSPVVEAMTTHIVREATVGGYEAADDAESDIEGTYDAVGNLINAAARNVAVVENATVAFFQALSAFDFEPGDELVTSRNDYISNQLAYLSLAQRRGLVIRRANDLPGGGVDPDSVRTLLRSPKVRLLAITWVPTNSGLIQPVEAIGRIAEEAGVPYLIDACQAAGQLPIDVARLRCDFLSATARKFLRGPRGIGFLYVSDRVLQRGMFPLYLDMRGGAWKAADSFELFPDARRFENWEFPYALVLGLGAAARYAAQAGVHLTGARARELAEQLRTSLRAMPGFRVLDRGNELAAIVTAEIAGRHATDVVRSLRERGINSSASIREYAVIDMDEKRATSAIRLSPHYFNTSEEIAQAVDVLKSL